MKYLQLLSVLLLSLVIKETTCKKLPPFITPCRYNEKEMSDCFANNINGMRKELADGIKGFGLPPLRRIPVSQISLNLINNNLNISLSLNNALIKGVENFVLNHVNYDVQKNVFDITLAVPLLQMTSKYHMKGKIFVFDLDTNGFIAINFTNILLTSKWSGKEYKKNGEKYLKFHTNKYNVTLDKIHVEFDDLINDVPEISNAINNVFNENWKLVFNEPAVIDTIKNILSTLINSVFDRFSIDDLFPKNIK